MTEKIHCDLMEVYGPDWASLTPKQVECLVNAIHSSQELFGDEPELYGFVGTRRMGNIVGGYFAIQYHDEEYHYTKDKELNIKKSNPFARIFFVFFAKPGKLLLQNTKFVGIPLTMEMAHAKFRKALDVTLRSCGISQTFNIAIAPEKTGDADFLSEFKRSTRVVRLKIENPTDSGIPVDFVYYNPQIDRNAIIRDSHRHDYPHLKRVDLEATTNGDLKKVHLRDLIYAGRPTEMQYFVKTEEFTLRREARRKFEFYIDMGSEQLPDENLHIVVETLRRERAVFLETPTPKTPERPNDPESHQQLPLFNNQD